MLQFREIQDESMGVNGLPTLTVMPFRSNSDANVGHSAELWYVGLNSNIANNYNCSQATTNCALEGALLVMRDRAAVWV